MEHICNECIYYDKHNKKTSSKMMFYCNNIGTYKEPDDGKKCIHYSGYSNKGSYKSQNCFITTIVVDMCGFSDEQSRLLNTLRWFRGNILQNSEFGQEYLKLYDVIGPQIAENLALEDDKELAFKLYSEGIMPVAQNIEEENYVDATTMYKTLVYRLAEKYNISTNINDYEYDINVKSDEKGHGKARVYKRTVN